VDKEKERQTALLKEAYGRTRKELQIDPIVEGKDLQRRIMHLLWGPEFMKLSSNDERDTAVRTANRLVDRYGNRAKVFWEAFQSYCFFQGKLRGLGDMKGYLDDIDKDYATQLTAITRTFEIGREKVKEQNRGQ